MCLADLAENVIDVCDCCGGDGEFDEPAAWVPDDDQVPALQRRRLRARRC